MSHDRPWPMRRKPLQDELLSSWLLRNVRAHSGWPHSFCRAVWGGLQIWTRDIDRSAPELVLSTLAAKTQTSYDAAVQTLLRPQMRDILGAEPIQGVAPWVLPVGVFHRTRRRHGLQYCPECLATDKDPYFRRSWRMAYRFICPEHHCRLLDDCCCGATVVAHKSPRLILSSCHACHGTLKGKSARALPREISAQAALINYVQADQITIGAEAISRVDLMSGIRSLLIGMGSSSAGHRLLRLAAGTTEGCTEPSGGAPERLRPPLRAHMLVAAHSLLQDWPNRFQEMCSTAGCNYGSLTYAGRQLPAWIESALAIRPKVTWSDQRLRRRKHRRRVQRVSWVNAVTKMAHHGQLSRFMADRLKVRA